MTLIADLHQQQAAQRRRRLAVGFGLASAALACFSLAVFVLHLDNYPQVAFSFAAWSVLAIGMLLVRWLHLRVDTLPGWTAPTVLACFAAATALDIVGATDTSGTEAYPTAVLAVGAGLLQLSAYVDHHLTVICSTVLAVVIAALFLVNLPDDPARFAVCYLMIGIASAPPIIAVRVMRSLGAAAKLELDRAQAHSAVSASGSSVGLLASEELARLDLDAERLLDQVATERIRLPLDAGTAETAASIATQLRLHLLAGRTRTWLHHAVSESEFLGRAVSIIDSEGLAGTLATQQRDGLLSAIWLLLASGGKTNPSVRVLLSPPARDASGAPIEPVTVPISILATGVPRKGVDPATWHAVGKVGRYDESMASSGLLIEIGCPITDGAVNDLKPGGPHTT